MNAGKLRFRVTLQKPVLMGDGMGGGIQTWSDVATVWADVVPTNASNISNIENFNSDQTRPVQHCIVKIRYHPGIDADMRLIHRNRVLEILSVVDVDERKREIHLYCREGG
mgnify:CR=1 FL=1